MQRDRLALLAALILAGAVLGPASAHPGRYGGILTIGLSGGEPNSLDPTVGGNTSALVLYPHMCQRLYAFDAKQQLTPVLAAALPSISKDKLSYTVPIRQGIRFNDGTPLDAQAVVTSVQRLMNYPGSTRASEFAGVDGVSASGPFTVVYHLKVRDATFIGNPYVFSPTQLAKLGDNFASAPVCVGPFMFDHRVLGDNITLIKSPYYYDQKDVFLDKLVFKPMANATAAVAALEAGDIQALDQVSATDLPSVQQSSSLQVISAPQLGWQGIEINIGNRNGIGNPYGPVQTPLGSSAKLRQAFEEAIDRKALNDVVFGGLMQDSCTPISRVDTAWFAATTVPCTPFDPKDARRLVAASGLTSPTVHLSTSNTTDRLRLAAFLQAEEAAVGINLVIDSFDSVTALARGTAGNFDARLGSNLTSNPDPSLPIYAYVATSGASNFSGYSNTRLDYVLTNGLKATDTKARGVNYHVAQQIIAADRPIVVLYSAVTYAASSTSLTGVQLGATGLIRVDQARYR